MSVFWLTLFAVVQTSDAPKTVNNIELGPASEFTVKGPATVCMRSLVVRLAEGQKVQLAYSGIDYGKLKLTLADATEIEIAEGDTFRDQRVRSQRAAWIQKGMGFFHVDEPFENTRYQIEGTRRSSRWNSRPRGFVSSSALKGRRSDRRLLKSLSFVRSDKVQCDRRFEYGWGVILGNEPLDSQPSDSAADATGKEN